MAHSFALRGAVLVRQRACRHFLRDRVEVFLRSDENPRVHGRGQSAASFLRDRYDVIRVVSGIVLVALGLLVFFDRTWWLSVAVSHILRVLGLDSLTT